MSSAASRLLGPHPRAAPGSVFRITAEAVRDDDGRVAFRFLAEGALSSLAIPLPVVTPQQKHGLWKHTCFEAFVMAGEGPGYREFNFSPSSEWAAYIFRGYRDGGELELEMGPGILVRRSGDRLELNAEIREDFLPPGRLLRLGLSAVVEDADGVLSYWALRHPPGKPDFHHSDAFAFNGYSPEDVT